MLLLIIFVTDVNFLGQDHRNLLAQSLPSSQVPMVPIYGLNPHMFV